MPAGSKKVSHYVLPCEGHGPYESETKPDGMAEVMAQLPGAFWTTDTDLRVTMALGGGLAQLGLRQQELVGRSLYDFFQTSDPGYAPIAAHHAALVGLARDFEFTAGGARYRGRAEPLFGEDGSLRGTAATLLDVSERQREEDERVQAARVEENARKHESLRVLSRGVAHTFNNLLTAVIGYAGVAAKALPADSPVLSYLKGIEDAAQAAAEVACKLGTYCGSTALVEEPIHFGAMVEAIGSMMRASAPQLEISCHANADLPLIHGDAQHLQRLIMTLFTNAGEAMSGQSGRIHVRVQAISVESNSSNSVLFAGADVADGKYVWLQVSDTGCGMDEETRARVFEPFFSTKFIGRGLGMAVARGIVQAHHGAISVSSKPGLGTTVHVLLPITGDKLPLNGPHRAAAAFQDAGSISPTAIRFS